MYQTIYRPTNGYLIEYNRNDSRFYPADQYDSDDVSEIAADLNKVYGDVELHLVSVVLERISF